MVSFADLIELPVFQRREDRRKKVFKSFWMTSDEIIKRIETETAKKKLIKKKKKILKKKQWQKQEK